MHLRKIVFLQTKHSDIGINGPAHVSQANKSIAERFLSSLKESESNKSLDEECTVGMALFSRYPLSLTKELLVLINILG